MSVLGNGVPVHLACSAYPTPRSGAGAAFCQTGSGQFLATRPDIVGVAAARDLERLYLEIAGR